MFDKNRIEAILRANGVSPTSKDEEIRSVLLSARWNEDEVDTALMVLKENVVNKETHIDTLHKVFRSDDHLSGQEISELLGIDVPLTRENLTAIENNPTQNSRIQSLLAVLLSILIAICSLGYVMYQEQAGLFHPSMMSSLNE